MNQPHRWFVHEPGCPWFAPSWVWIGSLELDSDPLVLVEDRFQTPPHSTLNQQSKPPTRGKLIGCCVCVLEGTTFW